MERTEWFNRKFSKIDDHGRLPTILERLSYTSYRLLIKVLDIEDEQASIEIEGKWSIKKEIGHLIDLEPLWFGRVEDLKNGLDKLREADLTNQKTQQADHDKRDLKALISEFTAQRANLTGAIRAMTANEIERSALHPRLQTPMHVVDLAYFVAEHDDHHLSQITSLKNRLNQ